jgi:hypothetical protein
LVTIMPDHMRDIARIVRDSDRSADNRSRREAYQQQAHHCGQMSAARQQAWIENDRYEKQQEWNQRIEAALDRRHTETQIAEAHRHRDSTGIDWRNALVSGGVALLVSVLSLLVAKAIGG